MKKEREFLSELYKNRIESIPFIEYFQNDRYFRNSLFETYKFNKQAFLDISLFKTLNEVSKEIEDFRNTVLKETNISLLEYADNFAKSIISKLESTRLPKLMKRILNDFVNEAENIDLQAAYVIEFNDHSFQKEYGVTIKVAERKYRELKRYVNNHLTSYLKEFDEKENIILNKFKGIGYLDYKRIIKELSKYETISQKLDYLKIIKLEYHDKYEEIKKTISEEEYIFFHNNYTTVHESIFGNFSLITPMRIQEPVHKYYFKNGLKIPEYTYWFLKYNSEYAFNWYINRKEFKSQVNSKLKETFIKAELKQLNDFEERAKELLLNKELDIYKPHRNNYNYSKEIVLLRVLDGNYYKENTTYTISGLGSDEVQAYFKYILLKPYLENSLKRNEFNPMTTEVINKKKKNDINWTVYDRVMHELNVVAWVFECQFMEASTSVIETPMLQSKGRYMAGMHITSNIEMIKLQGYIQHYTERFEATSNTVLVKNELLSIYEKAINILEYFNKNLTSNSEIVKQYHENMPKEFNEQQDYFKEHSGIIVVQDLQPQHIVFGLDFDSNEAQWTHNEYNYSITHNQLALFCEKLIDFINKFNIKNDKKPQNKKQDSNNYSQKQVAIAYFFLDELINEETYEAILKKHTSTTSKKILQKLIVKTSQLTSLAENKTTDTKHLKDLKEAKRLLSGIKNEDAENSINQVISTFTTNYKNYYE